jgi:hypothetical protein
MGQTAASACCLRGAMSWISFFWRRYICREQVAEQLPLTVRVAPNHDVLAVVEHFACLVAQLILADFSGRRTMTEDLDSLEADGCDPRIYSPLPELLNRFCASDGLAPGRPVILM